MLGSLLASLPGAVRRVLAVPGQRPGAGTVLGSADILVEQGRIGEAIDVLLAQSSDFERDGGAAHRAVKLLRAAGRGTEVEAVLLRIADAGDWDADEQYAVLLREQGRVAELRTRAAAGSWHARDVLADVLAERGDLEELRERADGGDALAARRLAAVLAADRQEDRLRQRANAGDRAAAKYLVDLLLARDADDEAERVLEASLKAGNPDSGERLARLRASRTPPG